MLLNLSDKGSCERAQLLFLAWCDQKASLAGQLGRCPGTEARAAKSQIKLLWVQCCQLAPILAGSLREDICPLGQGTGRWLGSSAGQRLQGRAKMPRVLQQGPPHLSSFSVAFRPCCSPVVPQGERLNTGFSSKVGHGGLLHWNTRPLTILAHLARPEHFGKGT